MYWYSRHLCSIYLGGPSAKVGLSAKFGVAVFKAFILDSLGRGSIRQSMFVCQVLCTGFQGIYAVLMGGPLAKVGSSAKFGAVVFKASMLNSLGDHLPKYVHLPSFVYWYSRHLCSITQGGHLPKYVCLPSFVYWYSRHLYSITQVGYLSKYVCLPGFVYWYSRHLCSINWGVHWPKYVCLPSFVYWYSRHLCSINWGVHQPK